MTDGSIDRHRIIWDLVKPTFFEYLRGRTAVRAGRRRLLARAFVSWKMLQSCLLMSRPKWESMIPAYERMILSLLLLLNRRSHVFDERVTMQEEEEEAGVISLWPPCRSGGMLEGHARQAELIRLSEIPLYYELPFPAGPPPPWALEPDRWPNAAGAADLALP